VLAVDTNILVRYLIPADDPKQADRARTLIVGQETYFPVTVLLEAEWVLRSKYRIGNRQIMAAFLALAGIPNVTLQSRGAVVHAIRWASAGLDFSDALHLALASDADELLTFDRDFARRSPTVDAIKVRLL
jgi:predicted nucleic acid-binding protein